MEERGRQERKEEGGERSNIFLRTLAENLLSGTLPTEIGKSSLFSLYVPSWKDGSPETLFITHHVFSFFLIPCFPVRGKEFKL
jgi:hypothetical protein